ncbi:MAG TPA: glycosyltransferase family 2 protein [Planktothrix sp.]
MIFLAILLMNLLLVIVLYGLTWSFYHFMQRVEYPEIAEKDLPFVSVLVPARNEETKIGRCLESLLVQRYPNYEIVVIDDRSTDRTGEIIQEYADRDKRIKFVHGKDAPDGWIGKCNALAHAVGYASGDWYIFTDADTSHTPTSIKDSVSYSTSIKADLVSFVPLQELGSFWEKLIMQVLLGSFVLGDPFHSVNDPKAERAYAYGQYIICRRSTYNKIGGHQSVRDEIVEDHAIARVFKEKGYKIAVADGKPLYSVRMYTNLESLWQGWTKNLYSLIDSRIVNLLCIVFMINMATLTPYLETVAVGAMWLSPESYPYINLATAVVALENLMLIFWFNTIKYHYEGIRWWHFFWVPFGALAVTVLDFHAAYMVLSGSQVNWKGRRYTVNTSKTIQPMVNAALDPALDAAALDGTD